MKHVWILVGAGGLMIIAGAALAAVPLVTRWPAQPMPRASEEGARDGARLTALECFELSRKHAAVCQEEPPWTRSSCLESAAERARSCVQVARDKKRLCQGVHPDKLSVGSLLLCQVHAEGDPLQGCERIAGKVVGACAGAPDTTPCDPEHQPRGCVTALALREQQPAYCESLEAPADRSYCFQELSKRLGPAVCERNETTEESQECLRRWSSRVSNPSECEPLTAPALYRECVDAGIRASRDPSGCQLHRDPTDRSKCWAEQARSTRDYGLCAKIELTGVRDDCHVGALACSEIQSPNKRQKCQLLLAKDAPQVCAEATRDRSKAQACIRDALDALARKRAVGTHDCGKLQAGLLDFCLAQVARVQQRPKGCELVSDEYSRALCSIDVARQMNDPRPCLSLHPRYRSLCFSRWQGPMDPGLCAYAPNPRQRSACLAQPGQRR